MTQMSDHALRMSLAGELHARPFPSVLAPGSAAYVALMPKDNSAEAERGHLIELLDRYGAPHPPEGAKHWSGAIGRHQLKWEQHTEFTTYLIWQIGVPEAAFHPDEFLVFPREWLARAPGLRVTSALLRIEQVGRDEDVADKISTWFVEESVALSNVLDESLLIAGDFRIDPAGHMRLAVFPRPGTGPARVGRIVQRLCEIETYKAMSMLGFALVQEIGAEMNDLDLRLSVLIGDMSNGEASATDTLDALLKIAAELEHLAARTSYRFSATKAYADIVEQRIEVLRETGFGGFQTFGEFMKRRFNPAMNTVAAMDRRLRLMSDRALRASDLLRTRVDVERSAQNQKLLESMDRRADLALRLQHTVEGLSVVAISYYAVGLGLYLLVPLGEAVGIGKSVVAALLVPVVILGVWLAVHRIRRGLE